HSGTIYIEDKLVFEPPAIWSAVYRSDAIKVRNIKLPETPGAGYQDTSFALICFLSGMRYLWLDEPYYMYRVDREDASRHQKNKSNEILNIFNFTRAYLDGHGYLTPISMPYFYAVYF